VLLSFEDLPNPLDERLQFLNLLTAR
jgi:hypothetical protein